MPYIIFFIDDLADLMRQDHELAIIAKKVIADIAEQKESVGIHLVICTQVPKKDVITEEIKKHIPYRIGFQVLSSRDSQAILDEDGAESLYGLGDMLIKTDVLASLIRGQEVFIRDNELIKFTNFISESCKKI
jgi:S-DNA-T family DNA segregation ATPase FtsK/SpoIIIE